MRFLRWLGALLAAAVVGGLAALFGLGLTKSKKPLKLIDDIYDDEVERLRATASEDIDAVKRAAREKEDAIRRESERVAAGSLDDLARHFDES